MLALVGLTVSRVGAGWWLGPIRSSGPVEVPLFPRRFDWTEVEAAMQNVRARWPQRRMVLLTDIPPSPQLGDIDSVHCGFESIERLAEFAPQDTIFVYACDGDAIGLPYVRKIVGDGGIFYPVQVYTPATFAQVDEAARNAIANEYARQARENFQKFDFGPGDSLNLAQAIAVTSGLQGAYLEVGCFNGSSACVALAYMRERGMRRHCYFLDVFDGFNYDAARESADAMWSDTHASQGLETVRHRICASAAPEQGLTAHVEKCNIISDALPAGTEAIVVANIDVDLYEAVLAALTSVAQRIVRGGIVVVEDPGHTPALIGSRLALQEFLVMPIAKRFLPIYLESGQTFLIALGDAADVVQSNRSTH